MLFDDKSPPATRTPLPVEHTRFVYTELIARSLFPNRPFPKLNQQYCITAPTEIDFVVPLVPWHGAFINKMKGSPYWTNVSVKVAVEDGGSRSADLNGQDLGTHTYFIRLRVSELLSVAHRAPVGTVVSSNAFSI